MTYFIKFSKNFHNYDSRNLEGKLCFWLHIPFSYAKYLRITFFDPVARREMRAIQELEKREKMK